MSQLKSEALISAISLTTKPVKVFEFASRDFVTVDPEAARLLVETGQYVGGGNPRRVRYLKPTSPPDPRSSIHYRPQDANLGQTFLSYPQNRVFA